MKNISGEGCNRLFTRETVRHRFYLDVDDLEKAARFYGSAFGLMVGRRFGAFGLEMLGSSASIYLLVKSPGTSASDTTSHRRSYQRHWTPEQAQAALNEVRVWVEQ